MQIKETISQLLHYIRTMQANKHRLLKNEIADTNFNGFLIINQRAREIK